MINIAYAIVHNFVQINDTVIHLRARMVSHVQVITLLYNVVFLIKTKLKSNTEQLFKKAKDLIM